MNKWIYMSVLIVIIIGLLFLPIVDETSSGTRVVVDHSTSEIIHPDCFEQAEKTNWIDEVSYKLAKDKYNYKVTNTCSQELLSNKKTSIIKRVLK
ncbi:alpha-amylase [Phocicoccus pinnipedialis]|uniref:Uncharacterized protein n=1 Tax=Phocicoccus pinnipedialis TaxID=110845 RepID=A0A6V7RA00_9BACL|nr:alpha-amylase [Jeotgalicoccus pinnipedialis]MBP1940200.1 hypothetical protein [Jeotgalicoccus pinnipedialis]CAD2073983.1 hypothetical protein JEOPIN946_00780 [Jeotgalicoccus pinnipedialis]